jgi:hypothetical protein
MREVVAKFLEVLLAQHLLFSFIWTPSHAREFYNFRLLFATEVSVSGEALVDRERASQVAGGEGVS